MRKCISTINSRKQQKNAISMLNIVKYPHPVLRHESRPIRRVDKELREIVRTMFDLMYNNSGVGLAANQVGLPYRLVVMNMNPDARDPRDEIVLINPVILKKSGHEENEEGCLSLPRIYAPVPRSANVTATAYDLAGGRAEIQGDRASGSGVSARVRSSRRGPLHRPDDRPRRTGVGDEDP